MDQRATIEDLLQHAGWLRRLATNLVTDPGAADDLVQETWIRALAHPPRKGASPKPWLSRVLRNLARNKTRGDSRRTDREVQAAKPGPNPTPQALAEEAELQRHVAEAVEGLREPLRSVVVLRYFRELDSATIARQLGLSASTVRWRLSMAREELRADLDRRVHGGREAWSVGLLSLLREGMAEASGQQVLLGPVVLATILVVAPVIAFALVRRGHEPREARSEALVLGAVLESLEENDAPPETGAPVEGTALGIGARELVPVSNSAPAGGPRPSTDVIAGRVLVDGHPPTTAVKLRFVHPSRGIHARSRFLSTGADGQFRVGPAPSRGAWSLEGLGHRLADGSVRLEQEGPASDLVLHLRTCPTLRGRVIGPDGPLSESALSWEGRYEVHQRVDERLTKLDHGVFSLDDDGHFHIVLSYTGTLEVTLFFERRNVGRKVWRSAPFDAADGFDFGEVLLLPGAEVRFRVLDEEGHPLEGAVARHTGETRDTVTRADGYQTLGVVPEQGAEIRFAALRHVDQVRQVLPGDSPEVFLKRTNALDVQVEPSGNDPLPALQVVVENHTAVFEEPGIFGNAWAFDARLRETGAPDPEALWIHFEAGSRGHFVLQHLEPLTPFTIRICDMQGETLHEEAVMLGEQQWSRITIPLAE